MKMVKEMEKGVFFATILKFQSNEVKKVTEKRDIYYQINVMAWYINWLENKCVKKSDDCHI